MEKSTEMGVHNRVRSWYKQWVDVGIDWGHNKSFVCYFGVLASRTATLSSLEHTRHQNLSILSELVQELLSDFNLQPHKKVLGSGARELIFVMSRPSPHS